MYNPFSCLFEKTKWYDPEGGLDFKPRRHFQSLLQLCVWPIIGFFVTGVLSYTIEGELQRFLVIQNNASGLFVGLVVLLPSVFLGAWRFYSERDAIRSAQSHSIAHNIRDTFIASLDVMREKQVREWNDESIVLLGNFCDVVCELFDEHFRELCRCDDVGCCVRVKISDDTLTTMGRSRKLQGRQRRTEAIDIHKGLPNALEKNEYRKAAVIRNIDRAEKEGIWVKTQNCNDRDIRSVIVLPINIKTANQTPVLLGILYITSSRKGWRCPFTFRTAEYACGFADTLAVHLFEYLKAVLTQEFALSPQPSTVAIMAEKQEKKSNAGKEMTMPAKTRRGRKLEKKILAKKSAGVPCHAAMKRVVPSGLTGRYVSIEEVGVGIRCSSQDVIKILQANYLKKEKHVEPVR